LDLVTAYGVIRKNIWLIAGVTLVAAILALGATYAYAEKYEAHAVVQVRPDQAESMASEAQMAIFLGAQNPYATIADTESKLITSRQVAEFVVDKLQLHKRTESASQISLLKKRAKQAAKDAWALMKYGYLREVDKYEGTVIAVQRFLSAEPLKGTYLIQIAAEAPDAEVAAEIANAATEGYLHYRKARLASEVEDKLNAIDSELAERREVLETAQARLLEYKEQEGIPDLSHQTASRIQGVVDLEIYKIQRGTVSWVDRGIADEMIERYEEFLTEAPAKQRALDDLARRVALAENDYQAIRAKRYETLEKGELRQDEVRVVGHAQTPLYPVAPVKVYWVGLAAVIGLLLGCGYTLLRARLHVSSGSDSEPADHATGLQADVSGPQADAAVS
jgi:uncharacterized protein involved in exopolysaccharide biosynthesis